jgi:hypothetical protein
LNIKERRRFPGFVFDTCVRIHPEIGNAGYWGTVGDISLGGAATSLLFRRCPLDTS